MTSVIQVCSNVHSARAFIMRTRPDDLTRPLSIQRHDSTKVLVCNWYIRFHISGWTGDFSAQFCLLRVPWVKGPQGYLAHKKPPTPLGQPYDPRRMPTEES